MLCGHFLYGISICFLIHLFYTGFLFVCMNVLLCESSTSSLCWPKVRELNFGFSIWTTAFTLASNRHVYREVEGQNGVYYILSYLTKLILENLGKNSQFKANENIVFNRNVWKVLTLVNWPRTRNVTNSQTVFFY